jgi:hypothetical protein
MDASKARRVRRLPGALALGLLSAFSAHALLYGHGHAMGGSCGAALQALAFAATAGFGACWFAICIASHGRLRQGSVLTASISNQVPSLPALFVTSLGWFWLAESLESGHAWAPKGCIVLALLLAAALIRRMATAVLRALARIALAGDASEFNDRAPFWIPIARRAVLGLPLVHTLRLFSRPPPIRVS